MRASLILLFALSAPVAFGQTSEDFSIVVLPDPQNYSEFNPAVFKSQTQWIVNNAAALNVRMVIGEGDMVNHDASALEWANADAAIDLLDGKVPYTLAIGNHDYDNKRPDLRSATRFNTYFGPLRYAVYSWYGGNYNGSNENFYTLLDVGAAKYLVLALEFYPRDSVLTWAHSVLNSYSDRTAIIVTHSFLGSDAMRVDACDTQDMSAQAGNNPQSVWTKLLYTHPNVLLVLSGHLIGNGSARRTDLGERQNVVNQIFTNFQGWTGGNEGYLRILKFHPVANSIEVITYSPWSNTYLTTSTYQFTFPLRYVPSSAATGQFRGKVRSTTCTSLAGAQVSTAGLTATADANGVYTLSQLPAPGGYGLAASQPGYTAQTLSGRLDPGFSTQLNIFLAGVPATAPCPLSTVDPSVTICTPLANGTVTSLVRIVAATRSSNPVSYTQVYIAGVHKGTYYQPSIDKSYSLPAGSHRITVQARNTAGVIFKQTIYATVSAPTAATLPAVTITSPANNAVVSSPIPLRATVTAVQGRFITGVSVYLDGVKVYGTASTTFSASIAAPVGARRLSVQAKDSAGAYGKATIYVTVK